MSKREELIEMLEDMSDDEFESIDTIDFRKWYYVKINEEYDSCWILENEIETYKKLYDNVEFELVPFKVSMR